MDQYIRSFTAEKAMSFSEIPVTLPRPNTGHTWSLSWEVKDGELVSSGKTLFRAKSDSGHETKERSSPFPGRIRIMVADRPFVPEKSIVGVLEYGLKFDSSLSSLHRMASQEAKRIHAKLRPAKDRYEKHLAEYESLQKTLRQSRGKRREAREQSERLQGSYHRLRTADRPEEALEVFFLLEQLLSRLDGTACRLSHEHIPGLLSLLVGLRQVRSGTAGRSEQERDPERSVSVLHLLYDWQERMFAEHSSDFPVNFLSDKLTFWKQVRDTRQFNREQYRQYKEEEK